MAKINLLPWREAQRKEKQQEFFAILGVGAAIAAVVVIVVHIYFSQRIEAQQTRNGYLEDQIGLLDKKIEEIKQLESEKEKLLARMRAIEQLQDNIVDTQARVKQREAQYNDMLKEKDAVIREKDDEIRELKTKINEMSQNFANMLKETLDQMKEKIEMVNQNWAEEMETPMMKKLEEFSH